MKTNILITGAPNTPTFGPNSLFSQLAMIAGPKSAASCIADLAACAQDNRPLQILRAVSTDKLDALRDRIAFANNLSVKEIN